jgi:hypothetical protein
MARWWREHALHRMRAGAGRRAASEAVERRLRRAALHDQRCDLVGVSLVRITGLVDAALQLDTAALLDHVSRLVRDREQVGAAPQDDVVAGGVRICAERAGRLRGLCADVGLDRRDVVPAERALDRIGKR